MVCSASLRLSIADSISSSTILMNRPSGASFNKLSGRTYSGTEGAIIAHVKVRKPRLGSEVSKIQHPNYCFVQNGGGFGRIKKRTWTYGAIFCDRSLQIQPSGCISAK